MRTNAGTANKALVVLQGVHGGNEKVEPVISGGFGEEGSPFFVFPTLIFFRQGERIWGKLRKVTTYVVARDMERLLKKKKGYLFSFRNSWEKIKISMNYYNKEDQTLRSHVVATLPVIETSARKIKLRPNKHW